MSKQQIISAKILALVANGVDVIEAMKQVCGAENVDSMISDLYETLRAK